LVAVCHRSGGSGLPLLLPALHDTSRPIGCIAFPVVGKADRRLIVRVKMNVAIR
jgi:hypothetical protein